MLLICFIVSGEELSSSRCVIQYWFSSGLEHLVKIRAHGNSSDKSGSFCRTHPSTLASLKEKAGSSTPKNAVSTVYNEKGGIMTASSLGQLP